MPRLSGRYIAEFYAVFPSKKYNFRFHSILFLFLIISNATTFSANADDNPTGIPPEYSNYKVIEKVELEELEYNIKNIEGIEDEFFLIMNQNISIASKIDEKAEKAPSIVTVITATEIENTGMRTLTDIIMTVPGFDIIKKGSVGVVKYGAPGVREADGKYYTDRYPRPGRTFFIEVGYDF